MTESKELKSPIYIAINMSKVVNSPESFAQMHQVGPRVCITTASHPGFVGFQANYQTGVLPLAGRYGGSAVDMLQTLNPIRKRSNRYDGSTIEFDGLSGIYDT